MIKCNNDVGLKLCFFFHFILSHYLPIRFLNITEQRKKRPLWLLVLNSGLMKTLGFLSFSGLKCYKVKGLPFVWPLLVVSDEICRFVAMQLSLRICLIEK